MFERLKFIGNPLFLVTVIVPTLVAVLYFGFLASDVYISESRFVVRSPTRSTPTSLGAVLSGSGLSGASEESHAVTEYILSRRALEEANRDGLITATYGNDDIFFFDRFGGLGDDSREDLFQYFIAKLAVSVGTNTQVTTLAIHAFDPPRARQINERLLLQAEQLVNSLSERARADAIAIAREEVAAAEAQARDAALELARFRDQQRIIDPAQEAQVALQMVSKLQDQLIAARTQLRQLEIYTPQASQIPFLQTQIRELEREIAQTTDGLAGGRASLSSSMVRYQELQLASQFAEQQLSVTLASLQETQAEARRKRAYIERIAEPSLPDSAAFPRRVRNILATFLMGLLAWGVLSMLLIGIKEHRD